MKVRAIEVQCDNMRQAEELARELEHNAIQSVHMTRLLEYPWTYVMRIVPRTRPYLDPELLELLS